MNSNIKMIFKSNIVYFAFLVFIIRIILSLFPSLEIDLSGWRYWSNRMVEIGPAAFYSKEVFTDNPPGFLYVFWMIGEIQKNFLPDVHYGTVASDLLLKLPTNIADVITGYLIYVIIKKYRTYKTALAGFFLYTLNPAVFFNSSIIGQFDGSSAFFSLLAVYLITERKKPMLSVISYALAWAIKPQAIVVAPILGLLFIKSFKPKIWIKSAFIFLISTLIIYFPFFPHNPLYGIYYVNNAMTKIFTCTSCFTFNYWGIFGNWNNDLTKFLNLSLLNWGLVLLSLSFLPIFFLKPFSKRLQTPYVYLTAAVSFMSSFIFLTRMHERYIFPFFAFFLIAAILIKSKSLIIFYIIFSIFNLLNLYFPYAYYNKTLNLTPSLVSFLFKYFNFFSLAGCLFFLILLIIYFKIIKNGNKSKTF